MRGLLRPLGVVALLLVATRADGAEINVEQGHRLARSLCSGCHAIEKFGAELPFPSRRRFECFSRHIR